MFVAYNDDLVSVKLIADKKTGKCRGFGFVTVKTEEKADEIVAQLNGYVLEDTPLKVEKALPEPSQREKQKKLKPTPLSLSMVNGPGAMAVSPPLPISPAVLWSSPIHGGPINWSS
ncbi:MAG: RNA-binding protein [Nodosilinea sp. LVE1205-7]